MNGGNEYRVDEPGLTDGVKERQKTANTRDDKRLQRKKRREQFVSEDKREEKKTQSGGIAAEKRSGEHENEGPHTMSQRQTKTSQPVAELQMITADTATRERAAEERITAGGGVRELLPPLRRTVACETPPLSVEQQDSREDDEEERDSERNTALDQVPGDGGVRDEDEEDSIAEEISVDSSSHSSSALGTPSTSTPLRPPLPLSSGSRGQREPPPPPPPPLSSSLSVIAEPPASEPQPKAGGVGREGGGRGDVREGGERGDVREGGGGGDDGCELREVVMVGGGEEVFGEDGESVSVTVTEISDEGEDDTMFEETLPQHTLGTYVYK